MNFVERVTELLPEGAEQQIQSVLPKRDFELVYRLDCRNLCADFQEDISFRFSLGITNLMRKFFGHRGPGLFGRGYQTVSIDICAQAQQNQQNDMYAWQRIRSSGAFTQSGQTVVSVGLEKV